MRTLPFPALAPATVVSTCIGGVKDPELQARLSSIQRDLVATATAYDVHAKAQTLHLVPRVANVGAVTKDELKNLYTEQMSATGGAGRGIYNALRNAANGKCPLCGAGLVAVLDHHLPKAKYPDLAVCPFNLVPACDFCNNAKRARFPETTGQQTIHPYYDDFTREQWVYAKLDIAGSPAFVYFVQPPTHWPPAQQERVNRHFEVVKLGHNYTTYANDELISLREHLDGIYTRKGRPGVQAYLDDERARYAARVNSWQHVMYQTLAQSVWFVTGGYLNIPT